MAWKGMDPLAGLEDEDGDEEDSDSGEVDEDEDGVDEDERGDERSQRQLNEGCEREGRTGRGQQGGRQGRDPLTASRKEETRKAQSSGISYDALKQHGYQGGGSVLFVPDALQEAEPDWSKWGPGRVGPKGEGLAKDSEEESKEDREKLREKASNASVQHSAAAALAFAEAERQRKVGMAAERKAMSFSQREKRKRDAGQATRGKNYVEEEKRQLRGNGVYSGFD